MKKGIKYCLVLLGLLTAVSAIAQTKAVAESLSFYTDRDYCLSGDSLWFKTWVPAALEENSNIIRVQLCSAEGSVIKSEACKSLNQWAEGFVHIPDSLSSGVYFIMAFVNSDRNLPDLQLKAKTLFVYNRFENDVFEFDVPVMPQLFTDESSDQITVSLGKESFNTREKVEGSIKLSEEIIHATVTARLVDPLAEQIGDNIILELNNEKTYIPAFAEKDGILLSGKVVDADRIEQENVLVLLSISSEPPYFDYCMSDEVGGFNFFLPNAEGEAKLIIQTLDGKGTDLFITPEINSLDFKRTVSLEKKILNHEQSAFIRNVIQANFLNKLFNPIQLSPKNNFDMPLPFNMPFYGYPTKRVNPSEFFDLPDFQEISRELLHGVQYRTRKGTTTIYIINADQNRIFQEEPLRLLNGVPIFKNSLLSSLKSTDISYIDIIEEERVYGDMVFNGVFAVSLYDKSNSWIAQQSNIFPLTVSCLQPRLRNMSGNMGTAGLNTPDVRQNYLWEILEADKQHDFKFNLSDLTGKVEIVVEGLTKENKVFKTSRIIEVK